MYIQDKSCVLCGLHDESFAHLFFQCAVTKELWHIIRDWLGINKPLGSAQALLRALRGIYRGSTRRHKRRIATIAATIYHIWESRNKKIFENINPNLEQVTRKIKIDMLRIHALQH